MRISRGYRNNNPLNIRRCAKNRWVGLAEVQGDGEFCQFRSMVYGFRAAFVLLRTYGRRYGCNTLRGIISRFAPPAENDTGAYVDFVSHRVGIGADCPIAGNDADLWIRIAKAMAVYENGSEPRHEDVVSGWQLARGGESMESNCSMIEKMPPKGVSFSDFIATFAISCYSQRSMSNQFNASFTSGVNYV